MQATGMGGKAARKGEEERITGHNPEECPVCMTVFDEKVQRPRTLPCGHTVCTLCVNKLKKQDHITCPECCVSHAVPEGGQFPVSYIAEALIRRKKDGEATAAPSPQRSAGSGKGVSGAAGQKEAAGLSRKMRSFLQEQEASVVAAITVCQEAQAQLDQYQTTLTSWGEQQQKLEDRLKGLLDKSRSARELVRQEESRAAAKKEEAKEGERQLHAALEALRTPGGEQEARVAFAEGLRCTFEAKVVLEECHRSFPDANTATTVRKVTEASNAALEAFQTVQAAFEAHKGGPRPHSEAVCTIKDRLQAILTPRVKEEPLQAKDLHRPTQPVRRLLEAGRVFGVHLVRGRCRHARISLEANNLYLHTLKDGPPPPRAISLQVSQVVPASFPYVVFLDLSWPGSAPRRVHIRLSPNTPLGRQMLLLCTGQHGPSYAGTHLLWVGNKMKAGECVWGGDYECNNEEGGAALLPGLDKGDYRKSDMPGAVLGGWPCNPAKGAQFGICTISCQGLGEYTHVFGEVVRGFNIVEEAAQKKKH